VFSVTNTSAGERAPSGPICWASTSSSSPRTFTVTPVCFSNACDSAFVVSRRYVVMGSGATIGTGEVVKSFLPKRM
jgi:hypothetical protein